MSEPRSTSHVVPSHPNLHTTSIDTTHPMDIDASSPLSSASSTLSSSLERESAIQSIRPSSSRKTRLDRPNMGDRQRSNSIIVPKESDRIQREKPEYPPDDARGMSPRRSSVDLERLEQSARKSLKDQARTLQSSLAALAERIDEVRSDHDKLETENRFLQDYIGGLTRSMSGSGLGRSGSSAKRGKK